jgi:hypothetical protein
MYGSIFNLSVKQGHEEALIESLGERVPEGMVAWFVMNPDDRNRDLIGVAVFESKEAYTSNANSPEQHEAFMKVMNHLNSEPDWTDGEYIIGDIS